LIKIVPLVNPAIFADSSDGRGVNSGGLLFHRTAGRTSGLEFRSTTLQRLFLEHEEVVFVNLIDLNLGLAL
jgi:hypothetical protein